MPPPLSKIAIAVTSTLIIASAITVIAAIAWDIAAAPDPTIPEPPAVSSHHHNFTSIHAMQRHATLGHDNITVRHTVHFPTYERERFIAQLLYLAPNRGWHAHKPPGYEVIHLTVPHTDLHQVYQLAHDPVTWIIAAHNAPTMTPADTSQPVNVSLYLRRYRAHSWTPYVAIIASGLLLIISIIAHAALVTCRPNRRDNNPARPNQRPAKTRRSPFFSRQ